MISSHVGGVTVLFHDTAPRKLPIESLGHRGDGVANHEGSAVFVAGALPGETVLVSGPGERPRLYDVLQPSPARVEPPCSHAGVCGACALQHASDELYVSWKMGILTSALKGVRLEAEIAPMIRVPPSSRRRVTLALSRSKERNAILGFHAQRDRTVHTIEGCKVTSPEILAVLPGLTRLLASLAPQKGERDVTILSTTAGLDVAVSGPGVKDQVHLAEAARALGLARLSVGGDVVAEYRSPFLDIDGVGLVPPAGGFVQAVAEAEAALAEIALHHLRGAKKLVDLFSGSGAFTLRLARQSSVHAVEGDKAAIAALDRARRNAQGLKPVSTEVRDLFRSPLSVLDLKRFDGAILDPPRQGASAQTAMLAEAQFGRLVYVSCDPASFARDARSLVNRGWVLGKVTPVDQFLWSSHLELAAEFTRRA